MKHIIYFAGVSLFSVFLAGCVSSKGYIGTALPDTELSIVNGERNKFYKHGSKTYKRMENVLLARVDTLEVGNYYKGWPKDLKIKPGEHIIEFRHFRSWAVQVAYWGGGALGAAASGAAAEKRNLHNHYLVKFTAEKGQSYSIKAMSYPDSLEKYPAIVVTNAVTKQVVPSSSSKNS